MRIDFDSAWKDTREVNFTARLVLLDTPGPPTCIDHEPVIGLDQEPQEVARALGDDDNAEKSANRLGGDVPMVGWMANPAKMDDRIGDGGRDVCGWISSSGCRCRSKQTRSPESMGIEGRQDRLGPKGRWPNQLPGRWRDHRCQRDRTIGWRTSKCRPSAPPPCPGACSTTITPSSAGIGAGSSSSRFSAA